jgi:hypothetical protein
MPGAETFAVDTHIFRFAPDWRLVNPVLAVEKKLDRHSRSVPCPCLSLVDPTRLYLQGAHVECVGKRSADRPVPLQKEKRLRPEPPSVFVIVQPVERPQGLFLGELMWGLNARRYVTVICPILIGSILAANPEPPMLASTIHNIS